MFLIPKKSVGAKVKYNFETMRCNKDWITASCYNNARSIAICGKLRGFKTCIRTVNDEIRVYITSKKVKLCHFQN